MKLKLIESEASECKNLLAQPWYPLGEPWVHSEGAGTAIIAGNVDPHIATPICDTEDLIGDNYDIDTARALADHIIEIHNNTLTSQWISVTDKFPESGQEVLFDSDKYGVCKGWYEDFNQSYAVGKFFNEVTQDVVLGLIHSWIALPKPPDKAC